MRKKSFCFFILALFFVSLSQQQGFCNGIRSWLICGPFDALLETEYIKHEASLSPNVGDISSGKKWKLYSSLKDVIEFEDKPAFGVNDQCVGYAYVEIKSKKAQTAKLLLGSDDGIKVWLNGKCILTHNTARCLTIGEDKLTIVLNEGLNRLLIKVNDLYGGWGFSGKITTLQGDEIKDLIFYPKQERLIRLPVKKIIYSSIEGNDFERYNPLYMIDNDEDTRWSSAHFDPQWVIFDFGKKTKVNRIALIWETAFAKDYTIEGSENYQNWKKIFSTTMGDVGKEDITLSRPYSCKFLKIYCNARGTDWGNSLKEVYIYGHGADTADGMDYMESVVLEKDKKAKERLSILSYPEIITPGTEARVEIEWNKGPSSKDYKLILQFENLDITPQVRFIKNIEEFKSSGKKVILFAIPEDVPKIDGYRFIAAFISKETGWDKIISMTITKNVIIKK